MNIIRGFLFKMLRLFPLYPHSDRNFLRECSLWSYTCPNCHSALVTFAKAAPNGSNHESAEPTLFQSTAPGLDYSPSPTPPTTTVEKKSFWASDGVNAILLGLFVGLVVLVTFWAAEWSTWLAPVATIVTAVGLYVTKIFAHRPIQPPAPKPEPQKQTIQIEEISEDGRHWLLNDLDERIALDDLRAIPKAVYPDPHKPQERIISRPKLRKAGLTKPKAQLILDELKRLNYATTTPQQRTYLSLRGKAFIKKITSLPY